MSLIGQPQDVVIGHVTDGDGRLGKTVRHSGGAGLTGAGHAGLGGALAGLTAGWDGRFEG